MYALAEHVLRWQAESRPVVLLRAVSMWGASAKWPAQVLAVAPGERPAGSFLSGTLDRELVAVAEDFVDDGGGSRLVDVPVGASQAMDAGLTCPGSVRVLVHPATDLALDVWQLLAAREPICLVTDVTRFNLGRTTWFTLETLVSAPETPAAVGSRQGSAVLRVFGRGTSATEVVQLPGVAAPQAMVCALWPAQRLLLIGRGLLASAIEGAARLLAWDALVVDAGSAMRWIPELRCSDAIVLLAYDLPVDGPLLLAALRSSVGYIGALGSRGAHSRRVQWLVEHGADGRAVATVHGPAGLDIGARTPEEIAVSIVAEILAVRAGVLAAAEPGIGAARVPRTRSAGR